MGSHVWDNCFATQKRAGHVEGKGLVPRITADIECGLAPENSPRIGHQNINAAEELDGVVDNRIHGGFIGQIGFDCQRLDAVCLGCSHCFVCACIARQIRECHMHPVGCERLNNPAPNPRCATRHEGTLTA